MEGRPLVLNVYSRHAAVRVYLNDQLLGEKPATEPYVANPRRLFQGRSLIVLRTRARSGPVTLTAQAPGPAPA